MSDRVLVCGGRNFDDTIFLESILDSHRFLFGMNTVIVGRARGADIMAERWALKRGVAVLAFPAEWEKYGKAAGTRRNTQMLKEGKPDMVIAFEGGRGTDHMMRIARRAGVRVMEVRR